MTEETLSIRHGQLLADVLGMEVKEIWKYLIDIVLWGEPDRQDLIRYRLYWAWKAIVKMQAWDRVKVAWDFPDQITAEILGWEYKRVIDSLPKSDQLTVTYSTDTWLAYTIFGIVEAVIKQSGLPYAGDTRSSFPEEKQWCWYKGSVAFVRRREKLLVEILVPNSDFFSLPGRHAPPLPNIYQSQWIKKVVLAEDVQKIQPNPTELDF